MKIVFVDDEPNVLSGLRRMLRPMRKEWDMTFFDSATDALASLEENQPQVVVSDMRMPIMDGAKFLSSVKEAYPQVIRVALSGQSDSSMIYRCVQHAHQYLAKPCDADHLVEIINRACALQRMVTDDRLRRLVSQLGSLPSLPDAYQEIMDELQSEDASLNKVASIIESDVSMTAKVLQLVNSAYFGIPRHVESPSQAVMFLGVDVIKNLVLSDGVFSQIDASTMRAFKLDELCARSLRVGTLARNIVLDEVGDKFMSDYAMMAGIMSDVGTLVLASGNPDLLRISRDESREQGRMQWEVETDRLGYSHMEVGAFLVALWGLPNPIVEAVGYHHRPQESGSTHFDALTAVHIAICLLQATGPTDVPNLSTDYLEKLGLADRVAHWFNKFVASKDSDERGAGFADAIAVNV